MPSQLTATQDAATFDMNYTDAPHLIGEKWRQVFNMRAVNSTLQQVPRKKEFTVVFNAKDLEALPFLLSENRNFGYWLALEKKYLMLLKASGLHGQLNDVAFVESDSRWSTFVHNNALFFTNEHNQVRFVQRSRIRELYHHKPAAVPIPAGRYVVVFFDHVVVGAPTYKGAVLRDRVMWSHLHDYATWDPASGNEADGYVCTEYQRDDDQVFGVTGLALWKNLCMVYTASTIYVMRYTGLPRVVRCDPLVTGFGNGLLYGVASLDDAYAFVDTQHRDFYMLVGGQIQSFGRGIKDYFFNDLNTNFALRQKTFTYVDRTVQEVVWTYVSSASSGAYDKAVAFNFGNKTWSVRSVNATTGYGVYGPRCQMCDELAGTNNALTGTIDDLGASADAAQGSVWGTSTQRVIVDAAPTDNVLLTQTTPFLETRDIVFDDLKRLKETSEMLLHCTADLYNGVEVHISVRKNLAEPVAYTPVGVWAETLKEGELTFTPKAGRIARYMFRAAGSEVRNWRFMAFVDGVVMAGATR